MPTTCSPRSSWFWDGTKQGGGALTDMLCHAFVDNDYLLRNPQGEDTLIRFLVES